MGGGYGPRTKIARLYKRSLRGDCDRAKLSLTLFVVDVTTCCTTVQQFFSFFSSSQCSSPEEGLGYGPVAPVP